MPIFNPDSRFMQLTLSMLDYAKLGLLLLVCSLPVLPMGAAAAAALSVAMQMARGEAPAVWQPFWKAFKENARQGTVLLALFALLFALLGFDWYQVMQMESTGLIRAARAGIVLLALVLTSAALYSFALIARYELCLRAVLRNALIYTLLYFPKNLLTIALIAGGLVVYNFYPPAMPVVVLVLPPVVLWYFARTCAAAFRKSEAAAE